MFAFFNLGAMEILIILLLAFLGLGAAVGVVLLVVFLSRTDKGKPED